MPLHIWGIFAHFLMYIRKPFLILYMTLQLLHSEFPYIQGKNFISVFFDIKKQLRPINITFCRLKRSRLFRMRGWGHQGPPWATSRPSCTGGTARPSGTRSFRHGWSIQAFKGTMSQHLWETLKKKKCFLPDPVIIPNY
jgi:hypothetical protein